MKNPASFALLLLSVRLLSAQPVIGLQSYVSGFTRPVDIVNCGDDRLFIVQQKGIIRVIDGQGNLKPRPFLDIDSLVNDTGNEQGLLGLAFHPDYKNNGYFFVSYIYDDPVTGHSDLNTRVARYSVSPTNPDSAVASSKQIVLSVTQPYTNHNAGDLAFGPDGYLYIPLGDGGSQGDPDHRAQNGLEMLGKILRINVNTLPYTIPPDNPYTNNPNILDEIWAIGMRNPWRISFDRLTGDLWIGDVGQNAREEVDFQPAGTPGGRNYGWSCYEGNNTYPGTGCLSPSNYTFPVFDYANPSVGCSVIGGYVYRGCKYPNLYGNYVFCDYCSGQFWTLNNSSGSWVATTQLNSNNSRYCAFGEDREGELYVAGLNGTIYKLTEAVEGTCDVTISGEILTETNAPVPGVTVDLSGTDTQSVVTGTDGVYSFDVAKGGNYTVAPSKSNDVTANNGITSLDILFTQRHILGTPITSPYKLIAADVNGSSNVTTLDIVLSRSMILANTTSYPNGRLWEFVKSDFQFPDLQNPFTFEKTRTFTNISESLGNQNFIGIKLGDVNNSWDSTIP